MIVRSQAIRGFVQHQIYDHLKKSNMNFERFQMIDSSVHQHIHMKCNVVILIHTHTHLAYKLSFSCLEPAILCRGW